MTHFHIFSVYEFSVYLSPVTDVYDVIVIKVIYLAKVTVILGMTSDICYMTLFLWVFSNFNFAGISFALRPQQLPEEFLKILVDKIFCNNSFFFIAPEVSSVLTETTHIAPWWWWRLFEKSIYEQKCIHI